MEQCMIWSEAVNQSHASQKNERGGPKRNNTCCHGRQQNICQACGGRSICVHGRRRTRCVLCGGGNLCPHGRRHGRCKEAACANWSRPISKLGKGANEAKATCAQEETTSTKAQTLSATNMPHVQVAVPLLPQAVSNGALRSPAVFPWTERTTDLHDAHMASLMTAPAYFPQYGSAEWTAQLQSYMQALPPSPHHHSDPSNGPLQHQLWLKHLEANIVQNQLHLHQMLLLMQQPLLPSSSYHGHPPIGAQHGFLERAQKISPPGFPSSSSQFVWDEQKMRGAGTAFRAFESVKPASKQPSYGVRYP